ncbi:hypothetical protein HYFRA_00002295 [Hymenoscyphus fraxineus]|uniref:F-box domain-containing protein n=1 Tax=Hymenoscyphus fraxineus TaxID=746836 RepID=A0A9N9PZ80_9HELO|nr:hypothetical protein HYFRA_00002295 [Hymenoscyphus fraxineus]
MSNEMDYGHRPRVLNMQVYERRRAKSSPLGLMTIPVDVRLLILESLLIDSDIIRQEKESPRNIAFGNWSRASTFSDLINISLTCKTLYREAREVFYTSNTFYLRNLGEGALPDLRDAIYLMAKILYLRKLASSLMLSDVWHEHPPFYRNFARVSIGFVGLAAVTRSINILRDLPQNPRDQPITKIRTLEVIIHVPSSFPLCRLHSDIHKKHHHAIITPAILAQTTDVEHIPWNIHQAGWFSDKKLEELESGLVWDEIEEAELRAGELSDQVDFVLRWEMFEFKVDTSLPIDLRHSECGWFRLQFLLEFHKRFDHGKKYAKRRAWLLSLGGTDAESLI